MTQNVDAGMARSALAGPLPTCVSALMKHYTAAAGPAAHTPEADWRAWGVFGFQELGLGLAGMTLQAGARS